MENSLKGLLMAAGIIITCVVISIGFYTAREARNTASLTMDYLSEFNRELSEEGLARYDGMEVTGSDIVNLIRRELGAEPAAQEAFLAVKVVTASSVNTYRNADSLKEIREYGNAKYINPAAVFTGSVGRDENDVINCISFVQKG